MWLKYGFMIVLKDFSRNRPQVARWGEVTLFHPTSTTPIPVQGLSLSNPFSWVLFLQNWEGFCTNGNYWGFSSSSSLTRSLALSISLCLAVTWFLCYSCWWRTVMAYCVWDTMAIVKQQFLKKMGRGGGGMTKSIVSACGMCKGRYWTRNCRQLFHWLVNRRQLGFHDNLGHYVSSKHINARNLLVCLARGKPCSHQSGPPTANKSHNSGEFYIHCKTVGSINCVFSGPQYSFEVICLCEGRVSCRHDYFILVWPLCALSTLWIQHSINTVYNNNNPIIIFKRITIDHVDKALYSALIPLQYFVLRS